MKQIARHYKLPVSGTKTQLTNMIFNYLSLSEKCVVIQRYLRGYFTRKVNSMRGPALKSKKRIICNNESDFFTLTPISEIPYSQFYSFKCSKGFIYGFDITSLYQMFQNTAKGKKKVLPIMNPYNRDVIPLPVYTTLKRIQKLSTLFGMNIDVTLSIKNEIIEPEFNYDQEIISICQTLDGYGNYTNTEWFTNLSTHNIIQFIRELHDIWSYRAQLSHEIKLRICPPHGNPFIHLRHINNILTSMSETDIKKAYTKVIKIMINSANDDANKSLGGMYVLTALTIVSPSAASAMPWLYESVMN